MTNVLKLKIRNGQIENPIYMPTRHNYMSIRKAKSRSSWKAIQGMGKELKVSMLAGCEFVKFESISKGGQVSDERIFSIAMIGQRHVELIEMGDNDEPIIVQSPNNDILPPSFLDNFIRFMERTESVHKVAIAKACFKHMSKKDMLRVMRHTLNERSL